MLKQHVAVVHHFQFNQLKTTQLIVSFFILFHHDFGEATTKISRLVINR